MTILEKNDLPESWELVSLSTIAKINPPKPSKDELLDNTLVSFVPMKSVEELTGKINLNETRKCGEVRKGYTYFQNDDILFAKITPCMENGKIAIADKLENRIGFGSTEFHVIRLKDKINPRFYFHYLIQDYFRNKAQHKMGGTAGQLRVSSNYMKDFLVPLPSIDEQGRIVEKIEKLFSKLNDTKNILDNVKLSLRLCKQSIEKSIFENLEKTCDLKNLDDVCIKINDGTHNSPPNFPKGKIPYITAKNIRPRKLDLSNITYISKEDHEKIFARCNPQKGDVLYTKDGVGLGYAVVNNLDFEFSLLSSVALLKPNRDILDSNYLMHFLNNPINYASMTKKSLGSAITRIVIHQIKAIQIPIPSLEKQQQIVSQIERGVPLIEHNEKIINFMFKKLSNIRSSILKQAFQGKLIPQDPNDEPASELLKRIKLEN